MADEQKTGLPNLNQAEERIRKVLLGEFSAELRQHAEDTQKVYDKHVEKTADTLVQFEENVSAVRTLKARLDDLIELHTEGTLEGILSPGDMSQYVKIQKELREKIPKAKNLKETRDTVFSHAERLVTLLRGVEAGVPMVHMTKGALIRNGVLLGLAASGAGVGGAMFFNRYRAGKAEDSSKSSVDQASPQGHIASVLNLHSKA